MKDSSKVTKCRINGVLLFIRYGPQGRGKRERCQCHFDIWWWDDAVINRNNRGGGASVTGMMAELPSDWSVCCRVNVQ